MQLPCDGDPPATSSSASAGGRTGVLGEFSVYVGNLDPETAVADMEELLYELFLQVRIRVSPVPRLPFVCEASLVPRTQPHTSPKHFLKKEE